MDHELRDHVLAAIDEYGDIPTRYSTFRHLLADAVVAGVEKQERRRPAKRDGVGEAAEALIRTWRSGHDAGFAKAESSIVDMLREAGYDGAADLVLGI